jgi:hypothetical protein
VGDERQPFVVLVLHIHHPLSFFSAIALKIMWYSLSGLLPDSSQPCSVVGPGSRIELSLVSLV